MLKVLFFLAGWEEVEERRLDRKFQGEGFDCRTNKTAGDGEWSNVAAQRKWIENRLIPGAGKGTKLFLSKRLIALHKLRRDQSKTRYGADWRRVDKGERVLR